MSVPNSISGAGFPSRKPTRRGGRGPKVGKLVGSGGTPNDHLTNLSTALETGDHVRAKQHAFSLIRSLPKAQQGIPRPNDANGAQGPADAAQSGQDDIDGPNVTSVDAMPKNNAPAKSSGASPRLAAMLKGAKRPSAVG